MGTCSNVETLIKLYNNLTDVNYMPDDNNFLESIKYKMDNGNRILHALTIFQEREIPFTIVKGFLSDEESFSKFERCIIKVPSNINVTEQEIDGVTITILEANVYELTIS